MGRSREEDLEKGRPVEPEEAREHGNDPNAVEINREGERESAGSAAEEVQVEGLLQGVTDSLWEYGSHTIEQGDTLYALTSDTVRLDDYKGERVRVSGTKVEGYPPKEGDPEYLNVTEVTSL